MFLLRKKPSLFLIIAFLIIFTLGLGLGRSSVVVNDCPPEKFCKPEKIDFSLFWEAWEKLQKRYASQEKFDEQEMIYGAISGMVKSLDDPYTVFFTPEETKTFLEDVSGHFEGVGIEIGIRKGQLQVIAPLEGTPAKRAGLRAGDKILKINETITADITIEEAVNLIRGQKGTEVVLTIFREEWQLPKEIKIIREVIEIPSLKLEIKEGDIAYIQLYHFSEKASFDFISSAIQILNSPAKKIILDLRNNPGGYLEVAQDIAGWFLEEGKTVVIQDFNQKKEQIVYKTQGSGALSSYPLVVLINEGSASAAEILAAALRDNRRIKLIGEKSFGKGSIQELEPLSGGANLKITVADWLTPKGERITNLGLEPDIKVEITEEDYAQEKDPQLEKAIEIAKGL